jgi:hypothetical protein
LIVADGNREKRVGDPSPDRPDAAVVPGRRSRFAIPSTGTLREAKATREVGLFAQRRQPGDVATRRAARLSPDEAAIALSMARPAGRAMVTVVSADERVELA